VDDDDETVAVPEEWRQAVRDYQTDPPESA
jgi:hypothetical protein